MTAVSVCTEQAVVTGVVVLVLVGHGHADVSYAGHSRARRDIDASAVGVHVALAGPLARPGDTHVIVRTRIAIVARATAVLDVNAAFRRAAGIRRARVVVVARGGPPQARVQLGTADPAQVARRRVPGRRAASVDQAASWLDLGYTGASHAGRNDAVACAGAVGVTRACAVRGVPSAGADPLAAALPERTDVLVVAGLSGRLVGQDTAPSDANSGPALASQGVAIDRSPGAITR